MSLARNAALATGLTGPDGPLVDVAGGQSGVNARGANENIDRNVAGIALSPLASGGNIDPFMLALSFLDGGRLAHPATKHHVIAWMPGAEAATEKQAQARMKELVDRAFLQAIIDVTGLQTYELSRDEGGRVTGPKIVSRTYLRGGPFCGTKYLCRVKSNVEQPKQVDQAPSWSSVRGPAWMWRNWQDGEKNRDTYSIDVFMKIVDPDSPSWPDDAGTAGLDYRAAYRTATRHLPAWAFYYHPPGNGSEYPAFFHRGRELVFITDAKQGG